MNFRSTINSLAILGTFTLLFTYSCGVDDPPNPNEEELITTVELRFTDTSTQELKTFRFADPDGEGGNTPTELDSIKLDTNAVYDLQVLFLDESSSPAEDITEEVKAEADEHLVCFTVAGNGSIEVLDEDGNNLPLGLEARLGTGNTELTTFTVSLKHQPDVKDGSCDVGETDVEVTFPLSIN